MDPLNSSKQKGYEPLKIFKHKDFPKHFNKVCKEHFQFFLSFRTQRIKKDVSWALSKDLKARI